MDCYVWSDVYRWVMIKTYIPIRKAITLVFVFFPAPWIPSPFQSKASLYTFKRFKTFNSINCWRQELYIDRASVFYIDIRRSGDINNTLCWEFCLSSTGLNTFHYIIDPNRPVTVYNTMSDWSEATDPKTGRTYYVNFTTKQTRWGTNP